MQADVILWGDGAPDPRIEGDRPVMVTRPCECGCDERDGPVVGYLTASRGGLGITIVAPDEETYQRMLEVFG